VIIRFPSLWDAADPLDAGTSDLLPSNGRAMDERRVVSAR
jgi:hypothetical protein